MVPLSRGGKTGDISRRYPPMDGPAVDITSLGMFISAAPEALTRGSSIAIS